jgi:hypothetical protein
MSVSLFKVSPAGISAFSPLFGTRLLMRWLFGAALVVTALCRTAAAVERVVEKEFPVEAGTRLRVSLFRGPIRVQGSDDGKLHLVLREIAESADPAEAERLLRRIEVTVVQDGPEIVATGRNARPLEWTWDKAAPLSLSCEVKVPAECDLELETANGDVTLGNHKGALVIRSENGAVFAGEQAGSVKISSQGGDVSVTSCVGELLITAKGGNVTIGRAKGPASVVASGGLVEVQDAQNHLEITADGADIRAAFSHGCKESARLIAKGGNIEAIFDTRSTFTLKAKSSVFSQIKARNLPLVVAAGKVGGSSLTATLNGGGPVVEISASGGSVRLVGREP